MSSGYVIEFENGDTVIVTDRYFREELDRTDIIREERHLDLLATIKEYDWLPVLKVDGE